MTKLTDPKAEQGPLAAFVAAVYRANQLNPYARGCCSRKNPHLSHVTGPDGGGLCLGKPQDSPL